MNPFSKGPMAGDALAIAASLAGIGADPAKNRSAALPALGNVDSAALRAMIAEYWRLDRLCVEGDTKREQLEIELHREFNINRLRRLDLNIQHWDGHPNHPRWVAERAEFMVGYQRRAVEIGIVALEAELSRLDDDRWALYQGIELARPRDIAGVAMMLEFAVKYDGDFVGNLIVLAAMEAVQALAGRAGCP